MRFGGFSLTEVRAMSDVEMVNYMAHTRQIRDMEEKLQAKLHGFEIT